MDDNDKRRFRFEMTDEFNNEYKFEEVIDDYDCDYEDELSYLLDQFKSFLRAVGFSEMTVSRLQCLEDDEWKYVLTEYNEWTEDKEKSYQSRKAIR